MTSDYINRWEYTLFEAGADQWPDECKVLILAAGLKPSVKLRLDREEWPKGFTDFTKLLKGFDGVFGENQHAEPTNNNTLHQVGNAMQIDIVNTGSKLHRRCFNCNGIGHFKRNCPKLQGQSNTSLSAITLEPAGEEDFDWGD
ncbi:hypothetical protein AK830_g9711 [Neonectria ditissima]|uniref:CCHC-type domain-containing protein n=1 Tax=Neonectria ditissima TaxID=78410 RepID=A0A0P7AU54_9HYPO|nr:hypothetical protein AK830_g9711 [Neonectria ditissima]